MPLNRGTLQIRHLDAKTFQPLRPAKSLRLTCVLCRKEYYYFEIKERGWKVFIAQWCSLRLFYKAFKVQMYVVYSIFTVCTLSAPLYLPAPHRPRNKMEIWNSNVLLSHLSSQQCNDLRTHPSISTVRSKRSSFASASYEFSSHIWSFHCLQTWWDVK